MYPPIITVPATITPAGLRTKYMPTSPSSMMSAAGNTNTSFPSLSMNRPATTLITEARISTTPRIRA